MKTNDEHKAVSRIAVSVRGLVVVGLLATALSVATISRAQSNTPASASTTKAPATATIPAVATAKVSLLPAVKPPSPVPHEGIAVHGYWTIDVRNPDGKLAKHMEFENQLCASFVDPASGGTVPGGNYALGSMLAGATYAYSGPTTAGAWSIVLGTPELVQLPGGGPGGGGFTSGPNCAISSQFSLAQSGLQGGSAVLGSYDPLAFTCSGNCFPALTVSGPTLPSDPLNISLSGQFTVPAGNPVNISAVGTDLFVCFGLEGATGPSLNTITYSIGPSFCQNAGNYLGQNNGQVQNGVPSYNPCQATHSFQYAPGGPFVGQIPSSIPLSVSTSISNCVPGLYNSVSIRTYTVGGQYGRAPFSGVFLTGTNGIPGPFQVSGGQTVAVTWTLSFQ